MFDGEALVWPEVKDAWPWQPLVREPVDPVPSRAVLLAAPRERAPPEHHDMVPKRCRGVKVFGPRVIGKEPCPHLPQPLSLARDRIVHPAPELLLDLPHLGPLTVASGPPKEQEPAAPRPAADMGEAKEVERFRLAKPRPFPLLRRPAAELDQTGLVRMQG